jgi:hypothetical protein
MGYWMASSWKAESEPIVVVLVLVLRRNEEWDLKKKKVGRKFG